MASITQDALSEWLSTLGYKQMARDVKTVKSKAEQRKYANFIVRDLKRRGKTEYAKEVDAKFKRLIKLGYL